MVDLWGIPLSIVAFLLAKRAGRRITHPLWNPTLVGIVLVVLVLLATGVDAPAFAHATSPMTWLLGPAVVALAVPLHLERDLLRRHAPALAIGVLTGAGVAMALGWALALLFGVPPAWELALTTRTSTSPIAIAIADGEGGSAALSAVLAILTGVVGATLGPAWLTFLGVRTPLARGVAHGVASHGIGTARMLQEGLAAGAASGVGMGLGGVLVAVVIPLVWG